ncbi:hypothetical protein [Paraliomyxa miuraensis]|uniref:hypothetical protein n=1 Tax=Paraliomyxa miuraensis TaxID=376150 RepID=UPI00224D71E1|nr:hypothetical protein [Paraliomyxa miuraensis]MCX4243329.1 hypothetical protein [Paraliomyxa miuraensis]
MLLRRRILLVTDQRRHTLERVLEALAEAEAEVEELEAVGREPRGRHWQVAVRSSALPDEVLSILRRVEGVREARPYEGVRQRDLDEDDGAFPDAPSSTTPTSLEPMRLPGVAHLVRAIAARPSLARDLTELGRTVAIVGNGSAVLDLGALGPRASIPVLEGKAALLGELTPLRAVPLAVDATRPDRLVATIEAIAPGFGAVLLEHVAAPDCFEVESRLDARLRIPVLHDDRAGTGVVVLAALLSASRRVGRPLARSRVGIVGMGAEGTGIAQLLLAHGVGTLWGTDVDPEALERLRELGGHPESFAGVLATCDVLVAANGKTATIPLAAIRPGHVILSLGATTRAIEVEAAMDAGAAVAADGTTLDTALAYPGILRGALEAQASSITMPMLLAAAHTLACRAPEGALLPDPLERRTHAEVAAAVRNAS